MISPEVKLFDSFVARMGEGKGQILTLMRADLLGVHLTGIYLIGVHLLDVCLIGVCLMGV
jgi:hypothetical protein